MPEWAKNGPIEQRNYSYRAEAHCALHAATRKGVHPTITLQSAELPAWHEYFDRHLGREEWVETIDFRTRAPVREKVWLVGRPVVFTMLLDAGVAEMTVPEQIPQWFDPSFIPRASWVSNREGSYELPRLRVVEEMLL